jgi:HlyD family secretion protein
VKKVQHPTGGTVGELRVRDGDHVKAGDIMMRLQSLKVADFSDKIMRRSK